MSEESPANTPYRVLARKYRPRHFDELVGQDALVRTLKNAITSGRIAQAYMLTGVRGVGKTTTARIIARAINYTGPDGTGGPTTGPTDDCPICQAIAEDRHPDVIEMDAASHTGVDDIRDIIEGVRYAPASARYKVYIIDEVHMLSKAAFNALLKTLEEPPAHAKFIFATTEIRKVPPTILSRCQRFDLRRMDAPVLQDYFKKICGWEKVEADDAALTMIARAAAGSARDGLSILDQAIALGQGAVRVDVVKEMLGLVDQGRVAALLQSALAGDIPQALSLLHDLDQLGADALVVLEDLLGLTHALMKARVTQDSSALETETARDVLSASNLPGLSRAWQILLRSLQDVAAAPDPWAAAEMAVIRLGYASTLPDPAKLVRQMDGLDGAAGGGASGSAGRGGGPSGAPTASFSSSGATALRTPVAASPVSESVPVALQTLEAIVMALENQGHMILASQVTHFVQLVRLEPGRLEFTPAPGAPQKLAADLGAALLQMTGDRWVVVLANGAAQPTLAAVHKDRAQAVRQDVEADPMVSAVLLAFPGTQIDSIEDKK